MEKIQEEQHRTDKSNVHSASMLTQYPLVIHGFRQGTAHAGLESKAKIKM